MTYGLRAFAANHKELLVASSFSKNFGLYNERVGAFTLVAENAEIGFNCNNTGKINYSYSLL